MTDDLIDSGDRVTDGPLLALHDELVAAAARYNSPIVAPPVDLAARRNRRPTKVLAAAAAIVLVVAGIVGYGLATDDGHAAADVTVQRHGDAVTVSLDRNVTVSNVYDALKDTGVDVTVTRQKTGPSRIGQFVGIVGPPSAKLVGGDGTSAAVATFYRGSPVNLLLGVEAPEGRAYDVPTDATARGEPLEGLQLDNQQLSTVRRDIEAAAAENGAKLRYQVAGQDRTDNPAPDMTVLGASAVSATEVVVILLES